MTDLMDVGFGDNLARQIVFGRPFNSVEDLKSFPGVTPMVWGMAEQMLCCTPIVPKRVKANINTDSAVEMSKKIGMSLAVAYRITGSRKRDGKYNSVDDLSRIKELTPGQIKKYKDMLEV